MVSGRQLSGRLDKQGGAMEAQYILLALIAVTIVHLILDVIGVGKEEDK
jgi:hypothetical protein